MASRRSSRAGILALAAVLPQGTTDDGPLPPPAAFPVDFARDVEPIFAKSCYACHGPKRQRSDYRLDARSSAIAGGQIGAAIVVGHSDQSALIRYVAGVDEQIRMPAKGEMLTSEQVGILRRWIDDGASFPDAADATRADHWSYQPIACPPLPDVRAAHWVRTPIDAFVLAKLEERGLHFAAPADRRTLLRRVTFDLTGLPPTLEELDAFEHDAAPDAYERVVDRLLASPRYGERQARRWMDLVHFAETHGNDQDRERPDAWPYRDWLIGAFNGDLPYAKFVQQQLAADVLFPDEPTAIPALGFLAAGPWDESSQLNIVDDTIDKQNARNLDRDDMVTTTMATFVSATVQCARCHNHKFDPISQQTYYQLQAVFAGIDRAVRPYDVEPALHAQRQSILRDRLAVEREKPGSPVLLDARVQSDALAWERSLGGIGPPWLVLDAEQVVSANGQTATKQDDGSILFGGERPDVDTTTITARVELAGITALRIDLLPDETLPFKGPGRQDNGNLHLSELTLQLLRPNPGAVDSPTTVVAETPLPGGPHDEPQEAAADATVPSASSPTAAIPVPLVNASADFDQDGWTSAMAIDGKPETAWGIYPQIGRPHHAVFELKEPLDAMGGARLIVTLAQLHGRQHLIGRVRLAVTTAPRPVRATKLPDAITKILGIPADQRTSEQAAELGRHVLLQRDEAKLAALPPPRLVYAGTTDFKAENNFTPARGPRPIHVLQRGDVAKPGALAEPAALACVVGLAPDLSIADLDDEGERRAALASWITDPRNSLTWRSIVNRAWQDHFGKGIVDTPSDFGAMGGRPSHPELLDWLASWFLERGGSRKALDRLIVTSSVYRQSSRPDAHAAAIDADDRLLWRMSRTRLDAESIRDAVLEIAGKLDLTMGGPSVKQFVESPGIHVTPNVDYDAFDVDAPASCRRSVYRFLFRTLPDPFMETMDCPDASQLAPTRASSVTPLQALSLLHNAFIVRMSQHVADRVLALAPAIDGERGVIDLLYRLVLARLPTDAERATMLPFVHRNGLANAARLLFNTNEFVFIE